MKKVIFVCLGNICRSPAAEYIFKNELKKLNRENEFIVSSRATSFEESGNDIYPPMKNELLSRGISLSRHHATRISKADYESADYIFYMEEYNATCLSRIVDDYKHIIKPISLYTDGISNISDPWYTGQFELVCDQIEECVKDILKRI